MSSKSVKESIGEKVMRDLAARQQAAAPPALTNATVAPTARPKSSRTMTKKSPLPPRGVRSSPRRPSPRVLMEVQAAPSPTPTRMKRVMEEEPDSYDRSSADEDRSSGDDDDRSDMATATPGRATTRNAAARDSLSLPSPASSQLRRAPASKKLKSTLPANDGDLDRMDVEALSDEVTTTGRSIEPEDLFADALTSFPTAAPLVAHQPSHWLNQAIPTMVHAPTTRRTSLLRPPAFHHVDPAPTSVAHLPRPPPRGQVTTRRTMDSPEKDRCDFDSRHHTSYSREFTEPLEFDGLAAPVSFDSVAEDVSEEEFEDFGTDATNWGENAAEVAAVDHDNLPVVQDNRTGCLGRCILFAAVYLGFVLAIYVSASSSLTGDNVIRSVDGIIPEAIPSHYVEWSKYETKGKVTDNVVEESDGTPIYLHGTVDDNSIGHEVVDGYTEVSMTGTTESLSDKVYGIGKYSSYPRDATNDKFEHTTDESIKGLVHLLQDWTWQAQCSGSGNPYAIANEAHDDNAFPATTFRFDVLAAHIGLKNVDQPRLWHAVQSDPNAWVQKGDDSSSHMIGLRSQVSC